MNLEFGDDIEKINLSWIRENLRIYESIWAAFIGHNGDGQPLRVIGFPLALERDRESFYQAHYTLLHCLIHARDSLKQIDDLQAFAPDPAAYLSIQREIDSFLTYVGRARDMFKKMDAARGLKDTVWKRFQDLYQKRCSVLHSSIPAQRLDDGIVHLPDLAGTEKSSKVWHDESRWSDSGELRFNVAPHVLREIYEELLSLSRGALSECLAQIKTLLSYHNAHLEICSPTVDSTSALTLSGVRYCYSSTQT